MTGRKPEYRPAYGQPLTEQEMRVLRMVAAGHSNTEIGRTIFTSENTIKAHLRNMTGKLGSRNRTHMVALAMERGLLPPVRPERTCDLRLVCILPLNHLGAHVAGVEQ